MGVVLTNKNNKEVHMGYISFGFIRQAVAKSYSEIIGKIYEKMYSLRNDIEITDEEYKKLLLDNGRVVLSNNSFNESFTGEVDIIDTYTYKKDYNIGDMVVVRNNYGISTIATISSVMESEDIENKYQVEPHFEY